MLATEAILKDPPKAIANIQIAHSEKLYSMNNLTAEQLITPELRLSRGYDLLHCTDTHDTIIRL